MKTHRCLVPDAAGARVVLPETEAHHVRHVLRLREGDALHVFDGVGHEWRARLHRLGRREIEVDLLEEWRPVSEPPVSITLAVSLLKADRMSEVVRDATALGVARIVPLTSAHVVAPAAVRQDSAVERLTRVAASSAAQCGRAVVPEVTAARRFESLIDDAAGGLRIVCVEPGLETWPLRWPAAEARPAAATLFVGPEGGWAESELRRARDVGAVPLTLGPRTLRAEIAPTVALSVLWAHWGWT